MTNTVRVEHLGSYRTDFYDILYFNILGEKTVERNQASLKSDKNKGYFT